ncbi:MAG: thiamine phosphate synthase, partial [Muribaculaceae bacterium]|nr:thiamine phosphate synthase [Muribaculaceae bacterium]
MIKLAITSQLPRDNEHLFIERVIDAGWDWVHLRHPVASEEELRTIIERIDPLYYRRIKLHSFPQLVTEYKLGGVHLNSRVPSTDLDPQQYSISRSCHTISELHSPENKALDYVTLSPIFDSVSKQGYKGTFDADELSQIPHQPRVIA